MVDFAALCRRTAVEISMLLTPKIMFRQQSYSCTCILRKRVQRCGCKSKLSMSHHNGLHSPNHRERMKTKFLVGIWILSLLAWGQQQTPAWQRDVLRSIRVKDWNTALAIVEHEITLAPGDMDVRAWRARILTWSEKWADAELEYQAILTAVPNDPDNWMGLAAVYSGEGRSKEALQALDR